MSTQYGTLSHRKTVQVPMWLIVALVVGALAIGVGYSVEQYQKQGVVSTSTVKAFPDTQVAAREGGAVLPATAEAEAVFPGGLETSGVIPTTNGTGGALPDTPVATGGLSKPIVINGEICHQCR